MADIKNHKVYQNTRFEVLSDTGFKDFHGIIIGDNPQKLIISFADSQPLICTPKHKIIIGSLYIYAQDLKIGDIISEKTIIDIQAIENDDKVYELLQVTDHKYLVNHILSHQCLLIDECVEGKTIITIKNISTHEIRKIQIKDLYDLDYSFETLESSMKKIIKDWEVLTPDGWSTFTGIKKVIRSDSIEFLFSDNTPLICTPEHKIKSSKNRFKKAINFQIGDFVFPNLQIIQKNVKNQKDDFYDLLNVKKKNQYLTNNVISHNCAHIDPFKEEEFVKSVMPVISSSMHTKIFMISCVTDKTYFYTPKGIQQFKEIISYDRQNGYETTPYSVLGKGKINSGCLLVNNGQAPTKIIKTSNSQVECSLEHKFWGCKNNQFGWYKSSELGVDDYISLQYNMELWGNDDDVSDFKPTFTDRFHHPFIPKIITPDLAYYLGLYISEGHAHKIIRKGKFVGGYVDITIGDDIHTIFPALQLPLTKQDDLHYRSSSKDLLEFMEYLGFDFDRNAPRKIIPNRLLKMSRNNIIALLQGLFDGDGSSRGNRGTVSYTSTSYELIEQLRMILLNFGILTSMNEGISPPSELVKVSSKHYSIEAAHHSSKIYYDKIGFRLQRKQDNQQHLKVTRNTYYDIIPLSREMFYNFKKESKIKNIDLLKNKIYFNQALYSKRNTGCSRSLLLKIKQSGLPLSDDFKQFLDTNVSENIKWEQIKAITDSTNLVYDFSLPEIKDDPWCHSVIYNGFIGHQTANGTSNHFYRTFTGAERDENGWKAEKIDWKEIPGRDEKWKQKAIADLGSIESFNQEYGNCVAGNTILHIHNKESNEISDITIDALYDILKLQKPNKFQIFTPNGFQDFQGIRQLKNITYTIKTTNNKIQVTPDHPFVVNTKTILASNLKKNDYIETVTGFEKIVSKRKNSKIIPVYDLLNVDNGNIYFTNDILSHNCFVETGETAIDKEIIVEFRQMAKTPEILNTSEYKVWENPDPKNIYIMGADVADGVGGAASVIQGLNITDLTDIKQAFKYTNKFIDTANFTKEMYDIAKQWGKPPILIERNSMGGEVINFLTGMPYNYERIVAYDQSEQVNYQKGGIYSSTNVKYTGISNMRYWINSMRALQLYDLQTIQELETFIKYPNGTWKHQPGTGICDDHVMALCWALFGLHTPIAECFFEIVSYDERGKPLKLKKSYYEDETTYGLNQYRKDWGAEDFVPAFIGQKSSPMDTNVEMDDLIANGWRSVHNF